MIKATSKRGLGKGKEAGAKATPLLSDEEVGNSNSGSSRGLSAEIEKSDNSNDDNNTNKNDRSVSAKSLMSKITLDLDAMDKDDDDNSIREKKKGHNFLFFCCDSKRATIILNSLVLILNLLTFTAGVMKANPAAEGFVNQVIVRSCGIFVTLTTILGALWYSKSVVTVGLAFTFYQVTMAIIGMAKYDWSSKYNDSGKLEILLPFIWHSMTFYAEGVFISEVHEGIMSKQTYKRRERYSCCCTRC